MNKMSIRMIVCASQVFMVVFLLGVFPVKVFKMRV